MSHLRTQSSGRNRNLTGGDEIQENNMKSRSDNNYRKENGLQSKSSKRTNFEKKDNYTDDHISKKRTFPSRPTFKVNEIEVETQTRPLIKANKVK